MSLPHCNFVRKISYIIWLFHILVWQSPLSGIAGVPHCTVNNITARLLKLGFDFTLLTMNCGQIFTKGAEQNHSLDRLNSYITVCCFLESNFLWFSKNL